MSQFLFYNGPLAGKYFDLPEGTSQVKVNYDPHPHPDGQECGTKKVGFYVYRSSHSLQWQPEPH